jgi:hypothetical protein
MYRTMAELRKANTDAERFFFSPSTMRFFKSRVVSKLYGGRYFITREWAGDMGGIHTVRMANDDASIDTVYSSTGEAHRYWDIEDARAVCRALARGKEQ